MSRQHTAEPLPRIGYSVKEVASALGLSARSVYRLTQSGELPAIRLGDRVVVPVDALTAYLKAAPSAAR